MSEADEQHAKLLDIATKYQEAVNIMHSLQKHWNDLLPKYLGITPGTIVTREEWTGPWGSDQRVLCEYKITRIDSSEPTVDRTKRPYKPWVYGIKRVKSGEWGQREFHLYGDWKLKV